MASTVRDSRLEPRTARSTLTARPGREPHWRAIGSGEHLGYYRGKNSGTRIARWRPAKAGAYRKRKLGLADDVRDADGVHVLSFAQAQAAAREWFAQQARIVAGLEAVPAGPYLVRDVIADYLGWYALHRKGLGATTAMANRHILPALGGMEAARLTAGAIREWHDRLALSPRGRRGKSAPPAEEHGQTSPRTAEATRARRATANRVLTVLKAALNHAYAEGKVASDDGWRRVQRFRGADAARIGYLDEGACRRLVTACPEGFRQLVRGALESGWVAAEVLGHSDTRMVERHYGHLAKGFVRAEVERTGLRLGDATDDNIVRLGERYSARQG